MNSRTVRTVIAVLAFSFLLASLATAQTKIRGTWTAEIKDKQPDSIQFQMSREGRQANMGNTMKIGDFKGLDAASVRAADQSVKFQLVRDAGTVTFAGTFNKGLGHGEFTFAASQPYLSEMKQMGFGQVEEKAFELAVIDVSRAYTKELLSLGYKPEMDDLIGARIFNVNREQVEGLKSVGATNLPLEKLVEYRIFNITPEYVREMRAAFPNISFDEMVAMSIHKATPEFAREMAQLGYSNLDSDKLVAFRIHNVTPQFIREMRELGFKNLDADQLVSFRIFGVGKEQIDDLAAAGYKGLTPDQLVSFRIHHIDSKFIQKVKKAGHRNPSPDELIEFKIMGIRQREMDL